MIWYFTGTPVTNAEEAQILSSPTTWEIIAELKERGHKGITARELSKKIGAPESTVYGQLKTLKAAGWVVGKRPREAKRLGRPRREGRKIPVRGKKGLLWVERIPIGFLLDEEFYEQIVTLIRKCGQKIEVPLLEIIQEITNVIQDDPKLREFFPKGEICEECKKSHEAQEFFYALFLALAHEIFVNRIDDLLQKYRFKST